MSVSLMNPMKNSGSSQKSDRKHGIFLLDDHPVVRRGLAYIIQREPDLYICGEAGRYHEALEMLEKLKPELVIVDISLDGPNGLDFIQHIKALYPDIRMLVHSIHDEMFYAERVLRAGARGYIMKQEAAEKIVEGIREVMRGKIFVSPKLSERLLQKMSSDPASISKSSVEHLSNRELEVFRFIGEGLSTKQIAQILHRSPKTIDTYRGRIKEKLDLSSSSEVIQYAIKWAQGAEAS